MPRLRFCWDEPTRLELAQVGILGRVRPVSEAKALGCDRGVRAPEYGQFGRGCTGPAVCVDPPRIDGPWHPDIVAEIARLHINELRYCYNRGLVLTPDLHGGVVVAIEVDAAGQVRSSGVEESMLADESVADCAAQAVDRWRFPASCAGGVVRYPIGFVGRTPDVQDSDTSAGDDEDT